jgi:amino-acid N-acetyltransferase
MDSFCRFVRIHSNNVIGALSKGMIEVRSAPKSQRTENGAAHTGNSHLDFDLTLMRLMIINKEGGIPSYARNDLPYLLVNVTAECSYIDKSFHTS